MTSSLEGSRGSKRFRGVPRGAKYPLLESASETERANQGSAPETEGHLWGLPAGQRHCFVVTRESCALPFSRIIKLTIS